MNQILSLEPQQVLVWTCVIVFIITCIITILGLIGRVKIAPPFLKKLFVTLILEIVTVGVLAFKDSFKPATKMEFIKIVSPLNNFDGSTNQKIFISGAFNKNSDETVSGELKVNDKTVLLTNTSNSDNIFSTEIEASVFQQAANPSICFSIYKGSRKVVSDCITIKAK